MTAEHDEADATMAAIIGEPPADEALADDAFLEEYRSATADVAVLRAQLGLIGRALAGPPGPPAPDTGDRARVISLPASPPARRRRARPVAVALKGLVAAAGACVVLGTGWLAVQSGGVGAGDDQGARSAADSAAGRAQSGEDAKLGHAGYLACARIVVEGTVAGVEPLPGTGRDRITLDVERYYKPDRGGKRITFPRETGAGPRLGAGDHVLVGIPGGRDEPDLWVTGEREVDGARAWITEALPESRTIGCR
ncbi:hypothetical protein ABZY20_17990 [Streptomyces sp. NPDC006624]|uniref:hypothetical protein n=1 Tax=unclassified Streptomyces TaxID=2593676 RepID=UPI0033B5C0FE